VVVWLHPGEELTAGALRALAQAFAAEPEAELLVGNALHVADGKMTLLALNGWLSGLWLGTPPAPDRFEPFTGAGAAAAFRRSVLDEIGLVEEDTPLDYAETEFFQRLGRRGRVLKLERTQALCPARPFDAQGWWAAWYERTRRTWPTLDEGAFWRVLRDYLRDYLRRHYPPHWFRGLLWPRALRAACQAVFRLGNPERTRDWRSLLYQQTRNRRFEQKAQSRRREQEARDSEGKMGAWEELCPPGAGRRWHAVFCGPAGRRASTRFSGRSRTGPWCAISRSSRPRPTPSPPRLTWSRSTTPRRSSPAGIRTSYSWPTATRPGGRGRC
jgi:hypothetical protein